MASPAPVQAAPASVSAPNSSPAPVAASEGPLNSSESIVERLKSLSAQSAAPADDPTAAPLADSGEIDTADPEPESIEGDQQAAEPAQPEKPAIKPPASWDKVAQESFAKLPPELQEVVSNREREREKAINAKAQEAAEARKQREELSAWVGQNLESWERAARAAVLADFGEVNWNELQVSDPATFLKLDGMLKQRLAHVEQVSQAQQAALQRRQQEEADSMRKALHQEAEKSREMVKALIPDVDFSQFRKDLSDYMTSRGVGPEVQARMSNAYEMELVTKAMLFDRLQDAKSAAEKKVLAAPPVMSPRGKPSAEADQRRVNLQKSRERLRLDPKSNDAIVAALRAL